MRTGPSRGVTTPFCLPDSARAMRPAAAALPRAVARLCVLGLWVSLVVCARGEDSGGRVGMEVVFPPERHVFQHADEVQFALLFDVESPEVCAGMRVCVRVCGQAGASRRGRICGRGHVRAGGAERWFDTHRRGARSQELLGIFGAEATIELEIDWERRSTFALAPDLSLSIPSLAEGPHIAKAWVAGPRRATHCVHARMRTHAAGNGNARNEHTANVRTPARLHACTPARLHACTPARLHARACAHTRTRACARIHSSQRPVSNIQRAAFSASRLLRQDTLACRGV